MAVAISTISVACTNIKETPKGFQFEVIRQGDGILPKPKEFILVNLMFADEKDSVWGRTVPGEPYGTGIGDSAQRISENGISEIWRMMSKGDSITFTIPARKLFELTFHRPVPRNVDPDSKFRFYIGAVDIMNRDQFVTFNENLEDKHRTERRRLAKEQMAKDLQEIDHYLDSLHLAAVKDTTGLRYAIIRKGSGAQPSRADSITVRYHGYFLKTGVEFDKSDRPITFGLDRLIKGWQIGFSKMREGEKATLYIPSSLAYGPAGSPPVIPANAILKFDVELLSIKNSRASAVHKDTNGNLKTNKKIK